MCAQFSALLDRPESKATFGTARAALSSLESLDELAGRSPQLNLVRACEQRIKNRYSFEYAEAS